MPHIKIRRARTACWIPKATDTNSEYVILVAFHCNSGCTNAPRRFVIRTVCLVQYNFFRGSTTPVGQGLLIIKASRSHSDTPHSVGLLWTSYRADAETSTCKHNRQIPMPLAGFEPAIPASERSPTYASKTARPLRRPSYTYCYYLEYVYIFII